MTTMDTNDHAINSTKMNLREALLRGRIAELIAASQDRLNRACTNAGNNRMAQWGASNAADILEASLEMMVLERVVDRSRWSLLVGQPADKEGRTKRAMQGGLELLNDMQRRLDGMRERLEAQVAEATAGVDEALAKALSLAD